LSSFSIEQVAIQVFFGGALPFAEEGGCQLAKKRGQTPEQEPWQRGQDTGFSAGVVSTLFTSSPGKKCPDSYSKAATMSTRNVMITDLDQPDPDQQQHHQNPKKNRKVLQTLSGNFNRRSRSVEVEVKRQDNLGVVHKDRKKDRSFNSLVSSSDWSTYPQITILKQLQAKDQQLEQLVQRLATLHRYNDQFAKENDQLRKDSGQLERRLTEAEQQVANCSRCQQLGQRLDTVLAQNRTLAGDVDMLKTLVFRLNVQIESYQDQRRLGEGAPTCGGSTKVSSSSAPYPPLPTHTLGPLLQAYDESLREKDALLAQYNTEFEHFTGELKRALEENTKLVSGE